MGIIISLVADRSNNRDARRNKSFEFSSRLDVYERELIFTLGTSRGIDTILLLNGRKNRHPPYVQFRNEMSPIWNSGEKYKVLTRYFEVHRVVLVNRSHKECTVRPPFYSVGWKVVQFRDEPDTLVNSMYRTARLVRRTRHRNKKKKEDNFWESTAFDGRRAMKFNVVLTFRIWTFPRSIRCLVSSNLTFFKRKTRCMNKIG